MAVIAGQQRPADLVDLAKQNVLIITGTEDGKATPWNEKCVPVWERAGGKVTFAGIDHMQSARKFFYIKAAKEWLFRQSRP